MQPTSSDEKKIKTKTLSFVINDRVHICYIVITSIMFIHSTVLWDVMTHDNASVTTKRKSLREKDGVYSNKGVQQRP